MSQKTQADFVRQALPDAIAQTEQEQKNAMSEGIQGLIKAGLTQQQVLAIAQFQSAGMQFNQALLGHLTVAILDHLNASQK